MSGLVCTSDRVEEQCGPECAYDIPVARAFTSFACTLGRVGLCLVCMCFLSVYLNVSHCLCGCASLRF